MVDEGAGEGNRSRVGDLSRPYGKADTVWVGQRRFHRRSFENLWKGRCRMGETGTISTRQHPFGDEDDQEMAIKTMFLQSRLVEQLLFEVDKLWFQDVLQIGLSRVWLLDATR